MLFFFTYPMDCNPLYKAHRDAQQPSGASVKDQYICSYTQKWSYMQDRGLEDDTGQRPHTFFSMRQCHCLNTNAHWAVSGKVSENCAGQSVRQWTSKEWSSPATFWSTGATDRYIRIGGSMTCADFMCVLINCVFALCCLWCKVYGDRFS